MKEKLKKLTEGSKDKKLDFLLVFTLLLLLCIGLIALSSASSYTALISQNDSNYYFKRQLVFAIIGVLVMFGVSKIDYKIYEKYGMAIYIVTLIMMVLVFVPGLGSTVKGATRWIDFGIISFQPSEIMKPALAIGVASYISKNQAKFKSGMGGVEALKGYVIPVCMIIAVCLLLYFQPHVSCIIIMLVIFGVVLIVNGFHFRINLKILIPVAIAAIVIIVVVLMSADYRLDRIKAFLNPDSDVTGSNWQPTQSLYAIGSGGLFGTGIGQSRQKYLWLPESQNDYVFSIFAEEFGFIGSLIVMLLFALFILRAVTLTLKNKDLFALMASSGIISMFAFQIVMNIAIVSNIMIPTGMPLPFFSYGGTSLVINLASVGIVLNITRQRSN